MLSDLLGYIVLDIYFYMPHFDMWQYEGKCSIAKVRKMFNYESKETYQIIRQLHG